MIIVKVLMFHLPIMTHNNLNNNLNNLNNNNNNLVYQHTQSDGLLFGQHILI
jgi:hypothetical protein